MGLSRDDHDRLNRLASEVKKGGGLALPFFFSAILNELLDNGPTDNGRLMAIVAERGVNKTKKLAETWGGSWEALTADLMNQLAHKGYVRCDGDRWMIGENFRPGVRLETIPARKGLNAADGVTVWLKEEREALDQAAKVKMRLEQVLRQPRGKSHTQQVINEIRNSYEKVGALSPVLVAANGRIIDGRHRLEVDPDWPQMKMANITTDEQAINAILELDRWHKSPHERLTGDAVEKIKTVLSDADKATNQNTIKRAVVEAELQRDATRSNRAIADLVGVSDPTVGTVRKELLNFRNIHRYEFTAGRGIRPGKHSAACWCPPDHPERQAGDVQPKHNGSKPKPAPKPSKIEAWMEAVIRRELEAGTFNRDRLAKEFGCSAMPVRVAAARIKAGMEAEERIRTESEETQTPTQAAENDQHEHDWVSVCRVCGEEK